MCLRICTGFKGVSFGRTDKIALTTCLKKLNVPGASLIVCHGHRQQVENGNYPKGWDPDCLVQGPNPGFPEGKGVRTAAFQFSESGGSMNGPNLFTELPFL